MATSQPDAVGARSIGAHTKKSKGGWLKWLLLLLLALIVAGILIALLTGGGDDASPRSAATQAAQSQASEADRVYVEFGGDVGEDETAADFRPAVGDRVNLEGELRPAPEDPGRTLRLERTDAQVVEQQGAFVNAANVARGS